MHKRLVIGILALFLCGYAELCVPARAAPKKPDARLKIVVACYMETLDYIVAEDYYLGNDNWQLRNVYSSILEFIGKASDEHARYHDFLKTSDVRQCRADLPQYVQDFLREHEASEELWVRRLTQLLLAGDPYARFFSAEEFREFLSDMPYNDDGVIAGAYHNHLIVIGVFPGSSADKAGIRPLDIIQKINGVELIRQDGESEFEFTDRAWTIMTQHTDKIVYTILRDGVQCEKSTEFKHHDPLTDAVPRKNLVLEEIDGDIGIITIKTFSSREIEEQFLKVYLDLVVAHHVKGIILNLRDNTGGYVNGAIAVSSFFTNDPYILVTTEHGKNEFQKTLPLPGVPKFTGPVAVVVNGLTASASEIVVASLREHGNIVVGSKTFGKNVSQVLRIFPNGFVAYMTVYKSSIPDGDRLISWGHGIAPDYEVIFSNGKINSMGVAKAKLYAIMRERGLETPTAPVSAPATPAPSPAP
ncbi:MAG: hypothetical protein KGI50_02485 [Patescibacteria group bacterium]|nr:hypothetical protein [Patescibacteria group bacterium]MDE2437787.1 hypothetical protein [Patescibacteria group bacterium]